MGVDWSEAARPPGTTVVVAGEGVNLRAEPHLDAAVVARLDLGEPLSVRAATAETEEVLDRPERWYEVEWNGRRGWIFGANISDTWLDGDLDRDGEPERAVLAWSNDQHLWLRLREGEARHRLDLGTFADIEGPLLGATLTAEGASPVPLLKVTVEGREMCASGTTTLYAGFAQDTLYEALRLIAWADAPVWTREEVRWERNGAVVTRRSGGETDEKGRELETVREARYVVRRDRLLPAEP